MPNISILKFFLYKYTEFVTKQKEEIIIIKFFFPLSTFCCYNNSKKIWFFWHCKNFDLLPLIISNLFFFRLVYLSFLFFFFWEQLLAAIKVSTSFICFKKKNPEFRNVQTKKRKKNWKPEMKIEIATKANKCF